VSRQVGPAAGSAPLAERPRPREALLTPSFLLICASSLSHFFSFSLLSARYPESYQSRP